MPVLAVGSGLRGSWKGLQPRDEVTGLPDLGVLGRHGTFRDEGVELGRSRRGGRGCQGLGRGPLCFGGARHAGLGEGGTATGTTPGGADEAAGGWAWATCG